MQFEKLEVVPEKKPNVLVKLTEMGNVMEVQYMDKRNSKQTVQMLKGGENILVMSTGEIKQVEHHNSRKDNRKGLYKTFAKARGVINANVTDVSKVRWITLTYAENMMDPKQLYEDFRDFHKRFKYYCKKNQYPAPEYIVMMEPQGRGAWHAHLLYIWDVKAPYIPNKDLADIWGHGFVKVKKLDNVDNVGAYLTAYLGDMELEKCTSVNGKVKLLEVEIDGKKVKKGFVKGARLDLYPSGFRMLRCSRGIKRPIEKLVSQEEARKKVLGATKTFSSAFRLTDGEFDTVIIREQYNKIRQKVKE